MQEFLFGGGGGGGAPFIEYGNRSQIYIRQCNDYINNHNNIDKYAEVSRSKT